MESIEKKYLKIIKKKIIEKNIFKEIEGILITGSIGRKDKKITDKNLNDVDLIVIANKIVSLERKRELEIEFNIILKTKFTDILFIQTKKFLKIYSKEKLEQTFYDISRGYIALYKTNKLTKILDEIEKKEFKVFTRSAYTNYCTRIWCLVGPYDLDEENKIIFKNLDFIRYQIRKAMSSIIDATLILDGVYKNIKVKEKIEDLKKTKYYFEYKNFYDEILLIYQNLELEINDSQYLKVLNLYIFFGKIILKNKILFYELIKEKPYIILKKDNFSLIYKYVKSYKYLEKIYKILKFRIKEEDLKKYLLYFK